MCFCFQKHLKRFEIDHYFCEKFKAISKSGHQNVITAGKYSFFQLGSTQRCAAYRANFVFIFQTRFTVKFKTTI